MRQLWEQTRAKALQQISTALNLVSAHPGLEDADKLDTFFAAIEEVLSRLEASEKASAAAEKNVTSLRDVSKQLLERVSIVENLPLGMLERLVSVAASALRARAEISGEPIPVPPPALRPPVPELTPEQIEVVKAREKERPWSKRPHYRTSAFDWVRDNYSDWIPGLKQSHLKVVNRQLYDAFCKRVSTDGKPDWLDVPSDAEQHLRTVAFSNPVEEVFAKRRKERKRVLEAKRLRRDF
jgi:hypothetical protein